VKNHSPAEWDRIVLQRAAAFVRILLRGRKLPQSRRSRDAIAAERDRLHVASDRALNKLVEAVEGSDAEHKRVAKANAAIIDGKHLITMTPHGLRFMRARKVKTMGRMVGTLYPRFVQRDIDLIDAELARRAAIAKRKR